MAHLLIIRGKIGSGKSTLASSLAGQIHPSRIFEIDNLKIEKYGTTERCVPIIDFKSVGHQVKTTLDQGVHAIVVEPLYRKKHFHYFLEAVGVREDAKNLSIIWLNCSLETALKRKGHQHNKLTIFLQFLTYIFRYRPDNEEVFDMESIPCEKLTKDLVPRFGTRGA